ncbi:helix-turn-helix transcriptional regulator [Saccharopolyspora cebuensis]|uniref:Multiprotein-bridging factor 1 family protein n=1 Tax=Saccharopolyspora cebuensis TaxID=418759 RepID=A0ABV4CGF1_9PSEU
MSAEVGRRIKAARQRAGMSRPVLAGLVGRSAEWLKAVEVGRLQVPRLPMLIKLARALGISDLAVLLALVAWALIFGPLFLLWWLPGHRQVGALKRQATERRAQSAPSSTRSGTMAERSRRVSAR